MAIRFTEEYSEVDAAFSLGVEKVLFLGKSRFKEIKVLQTTHFGKVLVIDDYIMLRERDEFIYHEMIAHVPLYVHPDPQSVLVVGGGDGGTVREILKHPDVGQVDLVDIDRMVSEVCLQYFPSISGKLLSEKVNCFYRDGVKFVKNSAKKYDVILIDSTDPVSVGEGLFTEEFYRDCFNILRPGGILVNQAETPAYTSGIVRSISHKMKTVFAQVDFYQAHIPSYPSGHWLFGFASKKYHPLKDFREDKYHQNNLQLQYYNSDLHYAAFALPNYVKDIVE